MQYENLKKVLEERQMTPYRLAKECNIYCSDMYQALNGKCPMFPKWRKAIASYLKMDESELFGRE